MASAVLVVYDHAEIAVRSCGKKKPTNRKKPRAISIVWRNTRRQRGNEIIQKVARKRKSEWGWVPGAGRRLSCSTTNGYRIPVPTDSSPNGGRGRGETADCIRTNVIAYVQSNADACIRAGPAPCMATHAPSQISDDDDARTGDAPSVCECATFGRRTAGGQVQRPRRHRIALHVCVHMV